jgi:hypothetical protein
VYNGGSWYTVAIGGDVQDGSKYSVSTNPSTGLLYKLHILNVGASDLRKHRYQAAVNRVFQIFYLQLILLGRCYYKLVIVKVRNIFYYS